MKLDIEPVIRTALQIARQNGYSKEGYYLDDGMVRAPLWTTREFAHYFFQMRTLEDLYIKSEDKRKLLEDYIEAQYPHLIDKYGNFKWTVD